jgi:hypothetical protein
MGARNYTIIVNYELHGNAIIEIGSSNGESSTEFLCGYVCDKPELTFITVDIDQSNLTKRHHENSPVVLTKRIKNLQIYTMSGEAFLEDVFPDMHKSVSFAYLDNFDWCWDGFDPIPDWIQSQISKYKTEHGLIMDNNNSQAAHLRQTELLLPYMSDKSIFLFDDTDFDDSINSYVGKGGTAIPFLLDRGWTVIKSQSDAWSIALSNFGAE